MRIIIFSLLLFFTLSLFAKDTPVEISILMLFDEQYIIDINTLTDLVDKEVKIASCVDKYIKQQSKSARIVQNNLYDLMNNFSRITSKIYSKKQQLDEISYEDKIGALAVVQCEAYYMLGLIK